MSMTMKNFKAHCLANFVQDFGARPARAVFDWFVSELSLPSELMMTDRSGVISTGGSEELSLSQRIYLEQESGEGRTITGCLRVEFNLRKNTIKEVSLYVDGNVVVMEIPCPTPCFDGEIPVKQQYLDEFDFQTVQFTNLEGSQ